MVWHQELDGDDDDEEQEEERLTLTGRELEPTDLPKCQKCHVDARCQWLDWHGADRAKVTQIIDITKVYQVAEEHLWL